MLCRSTLLASVFLFAASLVSAVTVQNKTDSKLLYCQPYTFNWAENDSRPVNISVSTMRPNSQQLNEVLAINTNGTSFEWPAVDFPAGSDLTVTFVDETGTTTYNPGQVLKSSKGCDESRLRLPINVASLTSSAYPILSASTVLAPLSATLAYFALSI